MKIAHRAQTKPTDHGLPAQEQVKGAGWVSQPRKGGQDTESASLPTCLDRMWHGEALFGGTWENIQHPALTDTSLLSEIPWPTPDKHTCPEPMRTCSKLWSRERFGQFDMTFSAWHCTQCYKGEWEEDGHVDGDCAHIITALQVVCDRTERRSAW